MILKCCIFFGLIICFVKSNSVNKSEIHQSVLLTIFSGKVEGKLCTSRNGKEYVSFLGLPFGFAKRFEIAKPIKNWDGVYKATELKDECVQFDLMTNEIRGIENCLSINVYTPKTSIDKKGLRLPVMLFLHGGGFAFGSGGLYNPSYFMDESNVIVVTANYRLGPFGFLDTEDGIIPANLGLRDQYLALEFVHRNLEGFGGDIDKVTVFGSSAGGASTSLLMLTEASSLFHRQISQSSTSMSSWLLQRNPKENAKRLASFLKCPTTSSENIVTCLRTKNTTEILNAVAEFKLGTSVSKVNFIFTPSIENSSLPNAFLTDCPSNLMKTKKMRHEIPWMVGFNKNDGLFNIGSILEKDELIDDIVENWKEIAPWLLTYNHETDNVKRDTISEKIKKQFLLLPNGEVDKVNFWKILPMMIGDRWEVMGTIQAVKLLSPKTKIYPYIFSYFGNYSFVNALNGLKKRHGVGHLDELQYLFQAIYGSPEYIEESEFRSFSQKLVKLWVQFADKGIPETEDFKNWLPVTDVNFFNFYEIDDNAKARYVNVESEFGSRIQFWDSLGITTNCKSKNPIKHHVEL